MKPRFQAQELQWVGISISDTWGLTNIKRPGSSGFKNYMNSKPLGTISQENSWPDRFEVLEKVIEKEQASLVFLTIHSTWAVWPMTVTKTHWNKMQCSCRPQPCGLGVPTQFTYHCYLRVRVKFTVCFLIFLIWSQLFSQNLSGLTAFCSRPLLASSGLNSGLVCPPHSLCPSCTRCGPLRTSSWQYSRVFSKVCFS